MAGRVFVTGGTGFVGSAVIEELLARDYAVRALVHRRPLDMKDARIETIEGDLFSADALRAGMSGCDAVIHLVGIIFEKPSQGITFERIVAEGTRRMVHAANDAGVGRFVFMSALGARPDAVSRYHKTKSAAEQTVRSSGLRWTIFRPSVIHGPKGEFMQMAIGWARKRQPPFLFMPYFGAGPLGRGGAGRLQPIYVKDVARAFVEALENPRTEGEVYPIGGSQVVTWPELHQTIAQAVVGKKRWVLPIPAWYAKLLTYVVPGPLLPFNRDQVIMSQEESTCDLTKFRDAFGWEPRALEESLGEYLTQK